ncbi:unnamed protein product [Ectocarpus sp. 4 AP-2014]
MEDAGVAEDCPPPWLGVAKESSGEQADRPLLDREATFLTAVTVPGEIADGEAGTKVGVAKATVKAGRGGYAPRLTDSRSLMAEIMTTLDFPRISFLRKEITKKAQGLDRTEFITTMATCIAGNISKPVDCISDVDVTVVANLCDVFEQVDINNDGTIDWDELSSFMIDMGMRGWAKSGAEMPNYVYTGRIDPARHTQAADQLQYFLANDTVAVIDESADFFRMYHADSMHIKRQYEIQICITYSESHDLVVAGDMIGNVFSWNVDDVNTDMVASCSMDHTVKLWDLTTLGLLKTLLGHLKGVKHMAYCPDHRLIVSGGFSYDLVVNNPYVPSPISRLRGHCSSIVGVEHVTGTSQASLITADMDGFCKLWDLRTFSCVGTFTSNAAASNKMGAKREPTSTCSPATREPVITCMTVNPLSKRVFVGGRTVDSFEVLRDECENLTDESAILAVFFNTTNLTFVTASARSVKVWDGATGELLCTDARQQRSQEAAEAAVEGVNNRDGEIFSMCLGARGRTILAGDGLGHIKAYSQANYTELKNYKYAECKGKAHEGNVRALIFIEEHSLLISASDDRSISIHDESVQDNGALLRRITNASWSEITVLRYSSHLGLIASGNTDGSIQLWNFEHARHEGFCEELHQYPVTCLAFLDPFPLLLSTDAAGFLALWAIPPARAGLRFKRLFTWINRQPVSDRMYGGGGHADGDVPVAVTALECQVEMISTSIAASTVTDSVTLSTEDKGGSQESSSLEMSLGEEEGEDDADVEENDDADGEADSLPPPSPAAGSGAARATEIVNNQHGADDVAAAPPERGEVATTDEAERVPNAAQGGDGCGDGADVLPRVADGNASHPPSTAWSGGDSQEQRQRRVFWNTEMLSYTVYTADEIGTVTTWDLKEVIIGLIRMYGGHELAGHGVGVVQSPAVCSNAFLVERQDAGNALREARYLLDAKAPLDWVADTDVLGLHR